MLYQPRSGEVLRQLAIRAGYHLAVLVEGEGANSRGAGVHRDHHSHSGTVAAAPGARTPPWLRLQASGNLRERAVSRDDTWL